MQRQIKVLFLLVTLFILYTNIACGVELHEKSLIESRSNYIVITYTVSADSKWMIIQFAQSPADLVLIDLKNNEKEDIKYIDSLADEPAGLDYYWENNTQLILKQDEFGSYSYYVLDIKKSGTTIKQLKQFDSKGIKFSRYSEDANKNRFTIPDEKSFENMFPQLKIEGEKKITLFWEDKKFSSYSPKIGFGLQSPSIVDVCISPDGKYIFYLVNWSGGDWNAGPTFLYFLDIAANKVKLVDKKFLHWGMFLGVWTHDSKKFIYAREINPRGAKIIELDLED